LFRDNTVSIASLFTEIETNDELFDPSVVKLTKSLSGQALYFSRQAIPYIRDEEKGNWVSVKKYFQHIGVYAFRPQTLFEITELPISELEKSESLEQLRWLENDYKIHLFETTEKTIGIDTQEDLNKFINILKSKKGF